MILLASILVLADVWLPVYPHERSTAQLHVQSFAWDSEKNCIDDSNAKTWTFPAEYTNRTDWAVWQVFTFNSKFKSVDSGSVVVPAK